MDYLKFLLVATFVTLPLSMDPGGTLVRISSLRPLHNPSLTANLLFLDHHTSPPQSSLRVVLFGSSSTTIKEAPLLEAWGLKPQKT